MNEIIKVWCKLNNFEYIGENKRFHVVIIKDMETMSTVWLDTETYRTSLVRTQMPRSDRINLSKKLAKLICTLQTGLGAFIW